LQIDELFKSYRLSEALKTLYSLIWDDFCSWYLEWVKPGFEQPIDSATYQHTIRFFEQLLQLLHPFMPFLTEEIYHLLAERAEGDDLIMKQFTAIAAPDAIMLQKGRLAQQTISGIRDARNKQQLKPKDPIKLYILSSRRADYQSIQPVLMRQVNASEVQYVQAPVENCIALVIDKDKFFLQTEKSNDTAAQKEQLQKDLIYQQKFLASVEIKLSNERFVKNAKPEVVEAERKKKSDAEARIRALEESLRLL